VQNHRGVGSITRSRSSRAYIRRVEYRFDTGQAPFTFRRQPPAVTVCASSLRPSAVSRHCAVSGLQPPQPHSSYAPVRAPPQHCHDCHIVTDRRSCPRKPRFSCGNLAGNDASEPLVIATACPRLRVSSPLSLGACPGADHPRITSSSVEPLEHRQSCYHPPCGLAVPDLPGRPDAKAVKQPVLPLIVSESQNTAEVTYLSKLLSRDSRHPPSSPASSTPRCFARQLGNQPLRLAPGESRYRPRRRELPKPVDIETSGSTQTENLPPL